MGVKSCAWMPWEANPSTITKPSLLAGAGGRSSSGKPSQGPGVSAVSQFWKLPHPFTLLASSTLVLMPILSHNHSQFRWHAVLLRHAWHAKDHIDDIRCRDRLPSATRLRSFLLRCRCFLRPAPLFAHLELRFYTHTVPCRPVVCGACRKKGFKKTVSRELNSRGRTDTQHRTPHTRCVLVQYHVFLTASVPDCLLARMLAFLLENPQTDNKRSTKTHIKNNIQKILTSPKPEPRTLPERKWLGQLGVQSMQGLAQHFVPVAIQEGTAHAKTTAATSDDRPGTNIRCQAYEIRRPAPKGKSGESL